jgi:hypothetical protein
VERFFMKALKVVCMMKLIGGKLKVDGCHSRRDFLVDLIVAGWGVENRTSLIFGCWRDEMGELRANEDEGGKSDGMTVGARKVFGARRDWRRRLREFRAIKENHDDWTFELKDVSVQAAASASVDFSKKQKSGKNVKIMVILETGFERTDFG